MQKSKKHNKHIAIEAIKKKLVGKKLTYDEIFAIMDEIANKRLGPVLTTYFAAAGFKEGFTNDELYNLTRAMVATGPKLHIRRKIIADKHSTGGVAGTRTTMILVPIIAAAGFTIPKSSSRAITSPAGTADTMEVVAPVTFSVTQIEEIVYKTGGCIVWGGHLGLAPADDVLIQVEEPLHFESYDKFIVSIMAKKIAAGATHVILDIPVGPTMKIKHFQDAELIGKKFSYLAKKFNMRLTIDINQTLVNAGKGVGPVLECKDVFQVLEQHPLRSLALEAKAVRLSAKLLDLCMKNTKKIKQKSGEELAIELLQSGKALEKMHEIIKAQGGKPDITSQRLKPGKYLYEVKAKESGKVQKINNQQISLICRVLGCPGDKKAGMFLNTKLDVQIQKGDILCTIYSNDSYRLKEAIETFKNFPVYTIQ